MPNWAPNRARTLRGLNFGNFRMKPMTVFPGVMMLIIIVLIVIWLRPGS